MIKKENLFLCAVLTLIVANVSFSESMSKDELFKLSFEGKASALTGKGSLNPEIKGEIKYTEGIKGKAAVFSSGNWLEFPAAGNIKAEKGTVEFWVKPMQYETKYSYRPLKECALFAIAGKKYDARFIIHSRLKNNEPRLRYKIYPAQKKEKASIYEIRCAGPQKGKWSKIHVTWQNIMRKGKQRKLLKIFLNGKKMGERETDLDKYYPNSFGQLMYIGALPGVSDGKFAIDELRILDRPLDDAEIWKEAAQSKESASETLLTIPKLEAAPKIDGKLSPGEWDGAFEISGDFLNKNMLLAGRQATIRLCYDESNLYARIDSGSFNGSFKTESGQQKKEVWTDDDVEIFLVPERGKMLYYQIGVNSADNFTDLKISSKDGAIIYDNNWRSGVISRSVIGGSGKNKVWTLEIAIPFDRIGILPETGNSAGFSVSRTYQEPSAYGGVDWDAKRAVATSFAGYHHYFKTGKYAKIVFGGKLPSLRIDYGSGINSGNVEASLKIDDIPANEKFNCAWSVQTDLGKTIFSNKAVLKGNTKNKASFAIDKSMAVSQENMGAIYNFAIHVSDAQGRVLYSRETPFRLSPLDFNFDYLVQRRKNRILIELDAYDIGAEYKKGKIKIDFTDEDGNSCFSKNVSLNEGNFQKIFIPLSSLPNMKKLLMSLSLISHDGKALKTKSMPFIKMEKLPSLSSELGKDAWTPPPFTDLKYGSSSVSCWNRKYVFDGASFLKQAFIGGKESLAGPIQFMGSFSDGTPLKWENAKFEFLSKKCDSAKIASTAKAGGIECRAITTVEFDGMIRVDLELRPDKKTELKNLYLDIPLSPELGTYKYLSICDTPGKRMNWKWKDRIGKLDAYFNYTFCSEAWLGNEEKGLCWCAEDMKNWGLENDKKAIEIVKKKDAVHLKINYFDSPFELKKPLKFTFGLQATPIRPRPANWRLLRQFDRANSHYPNMYGQSVAIVGWGANGTPPPPEKRIELQLKGDPLGRLSTWNDWPVNINPVRIRQVFEATSKSLKCKPFLIDGKKKPEERITLFYMPRVSNEDDCASKYYMQEWSAYPPERIPPMGEQWNSRVYKVFRTCYASSYADYMLEKIKSSLDIFPDIKGIYFDGAFPCGCMNSKHGHGYMRKGKLNYSSPIWGSRDFYKRLYKTLKKRGKDNIFFGHISCTRFISEMGFFDIAFDGEHLGNDLVKAGGDYISAVPLSVWRAQFTGKQVGYIPVMLSQAWRVCGSYSKVKKLPPGKYAKMIRTYLAMCLIHDILPIDRVEVDMIQSYYMALDEFGHWDADFIPYWKNKGLLSVDSPDIKISIYKKKGKLLLCAANLSGKKWKGNITLNIQKLEMPDNLTAKNLETGDSLENLSGVLKNVKIEGHDFGIYALEQKAANK